MLPADAQAAPLLLDRNRLHWQSIAAADEQAAPLMAEICKHWKADAVIKPRCAGWLEAATTPGTERNSVMTAAEIRNLQQP
jgi:hypothetical protein